MFSAIRFDLPAFGRVVVLCCSCWSCYLLLYIVVYSRCICSCLSLLAVACCCSCYSYIYSVESSCRPWLPACWYILLFGAWLLRGVLLPSVVVVCVERLKSSYIVLYYLACLVGRLSWSVVSVALACLLLSLVVACCDCYPWRA